MNKKAGRFPSGLYAILEQRKEDYLFRALRSSYPPVDFSSNDYLGFSTQGILSQHLKRYPASAAAGSTGSRLISGNSVVFEELEKQIALFHHTSSALLYNSGYDANLGLLSCVPQKGDLVITDELIHASLIDGVRLSFATHYKFKHNDLQSLTDLLERNRAKFNETYLVVESVYSMDGDCAPLTELLALCRQYAVHLIVDEAHAIGVFGEKGKGLCNQLKIEEECFARIYTYGKAMGCHGSAIVGSEELRDYLINFSRSFIYTTAMPLHSLQMIDAAYQLLQTTNQMTELKNNITYFNERINSDPSFIKSNSAIHCKLITGNKNVQAMEETLVGHGIFAKSVKSPTVKAGQERIRICLHAYNTKQEIDQLCKLLKQ